MTYRWHDMRFDGSLARHEMRKIDIFIKGKIFVLEYNQQETKYGRLILVRFAQRGIRKEEVPTEDPQRLYAKKLNYEKYNLYDTHLITKT